MLAVHFQSKEHWPKMSTGDFQSYLTGD